MTEDSSQTEPADEAPGFIGRWWRPAAVAAGALVLLAVVGYWFIVPSLADSAVRSRLERLGDSRGFHAGFESLETSALQGIQLNGLTVAPVEGADPIVTIGTVRATLDVWHLVFGTPVISSVEVDGLRAHVRPGADGHATNLHTLLAKLKDRKSNDRATSEEREETGDEDADKNSASEGPLRHFGGHFPSVTVTDAAVDIAAEELGWPVASARTGRLQVVPDGERAKVTAGVAIERGPGASNWQLPDTIEVEALLAPDLERSTGSVTMSPPLQVVGMQPTPYLRLGLEGIDVSEDETVSIRGLSAALQAGAAPSPLGRVGEISIRFGEWPKTASEVDVRRVTVTDPVLEVQIDSGHASSLTDLRHLATAPAARRVRHRARAIASAVSAERTDEPSDETDNQKEKAGHEEKAGDEKKPGLLTRILMDARTPEILTIEGAAVELTDFREMGLARAARRARLADGQLTLQHRPIKGSVEIKGGFSARSGQKDGDAERDRGEASFDLDANYRHKFFQGDLKVDRLDLSWLAQMAGSRLADRVRGGNLTVHLDTEKDSGGVHRFSGKVQMADLVADLPRLAEKPIRGLSAGYEFSGFYDPAAELPDPTMFPRAELVPRERWEAHEKDGDRKDDETGGDTDAESKPDLPGAPDRGAFVVEEGKASLGDVRGSFTPALYGVDGPTSLPTLLDLTIALPDTPVQQLFEAVPAAIRGRLNGTKMKGSFSWSFHGQFPLHNAGETEWKTEPKLKDFKLLTLPEEVDVRKLKDSFTHTIRDEKLKFERRIRIPRMKPVPARWIVENMEADLKVLDERRRERKWPSPPSPGDLGPSVPAATVDTPRAWLTEAAEAMAAERPWKTGQALASPDKIEVGEGYTPYRWARRLANQGKAPDGNYPGEPREASGQNNRGKTGPTESAGAQSGEQQGAFLVKTNDSSDPLANQGTLDGLDGTAEADAAPPRPGLRALDDSIFIKRDGRRTLHPYGPYVYVPLHHISRWMPRAIMTTEDNSFFEHHGFNWFALKHSLEDNLNAGGFVRGGSTVSMQLIKNLFLSFDKVLARKMREAFLVWVMEDVVDLPKARILELYFNIIEFGPGIYGIHDAAVHYFGRRPDQLSLAEVIWLVSIVPNPKEYHRYYRRGRISKGWFHAMKRYAEIMHDRERADEAAVERVKTGGPPAFYKPAEDRPKLRPEARDPTPDAPTPTPDEDLNTDGNDTSNGPEPQEGPDVFEIFR